MHPRTDHLSVESSSRGSSRATQLTSHIQRYISKKRAVQRTAQVREYNLQLSSIHIVVVIVQIRHPQLEVESRGVRVVLRLGHGHVERRRLALAHYLELHALA